MCVYLNLYNVHTLYTLYSINRVPSLHFFLNCNLKWHIFGCLKYKKCSRGNTSLAIIVLNLKLLLNIVSKLHFFLRRSNIFFNFCVSQKPYTALSQSYTTIDLSPALLFSATFLVELSLYHMCTIRRESTIVRIINLLKT